MSLNAAQTTPNITHLIFDFDGLLLNTEPIYCRVNDIIARRYGKEFTTEIHRKIMGRQAVDCAQILVKELDLPLTPEEHLQARNELIFDMLPEAQPMPGARALTQRFYEQGIPMAIATSSAEVTFKLKVQRYADWLETFNVIVLGSDPAVKNSKPAPDSFLVAAQRLNAEPAACLVFEDSPAGVKAGKTAGMSVVAVPAAHIERTLYSAADEVLPALAAFEPARWNLPA